MTASFDLAQLGSSAFENLVNFLALKTLGAGATSFGPGSDGGRDGYFEGEAPYPSESKRWQGVWYIQSKFHAPHLSNNPQKWLIKQVEQEIEEFTRVGSSRNWPDNWIIATNIDPSGTPETGSFDVIRKLVSRASGKRKVNVAIWGGRKILDLLQLTPAAADAYAHFLTPGHVIARLYRELHEDKVSCQEIIRYFVVTQFIDHLYTKLDRTGSGGDFRPMVHDLFVDLPFSVNGKKSECVLAALSDATAQNLRYSHRTTWPEKWRGWSRHVRRARTALIKGGPGQGKSTIGQYLCQVHRAALILEKGGPAVKDNVREAANTVRESAIRIGAWPSAARIPIQIELKDFAFWYSNRAEEKSKSVLVFLANEISKRIGDSIKPSFLRRILAKQAWIVVFDGLDEVPNVLKDKVAQEVMYFLDDVLIETDADVFGLCTSRPQGYSDQFAALDGPEINLTSLDLKTAMACASPLLKFARSDTDGEAALAILASATESQTVQELMTTPLQSHIMAMVVRDGGHPPEKRWRLFQSYYQVIKRRESLKDFKDIRVARLLREEDRLLKTVHMRLGFVLHARAESGDGAQASLSKAEFRDLVKDVVLSLDEDDSEGTVDVVMEATTERLVLVSTPDSGDQVRFDIRQLQEYFAAEFLYDGLLPAAVGERIHVIGTDQHWREVTHFLLSALVADRRTAELAVAIFELTSLNESEEHDNLDFFYRRSTPASLMAARLLIEGVLEEDQNDRRAFRLLFDALGGAADLQFLRQLTNLRTPKSRKWLANQFIARMETSKPEEYNGAIFASGYMKELDDKYQTLCRAFFECEIGQQEVLIGCWRPRIIWSEEYPGDYEIEKGISNWVIKLAISVLLRNEWLNYSSDAISGLMDICRVDLDVLECSVSELGYSKELARALRNIFSLVEEFDVYDGGEEFRVNAGVVSAKIFECNWKNSDTHRIFLSVDAEKLAIEAGGAVRIMLTCLWYGKTKSLVALRKFVDEVDISLPERISKLPDYLIGYMPIENWQADVPCSVAHLKPFPTTLDSLAIACSSILPPYTGTLVFDRDAHSDWRLAIKMLPKRVVGFIFENANDGLMANVEFTPEVQEHLVRNPQLAGGGILAWKVVEERNEDLFEKIKIVCSRLGDLEISKIQVFEKPKPPASFDLAKDFQLLRILAPALAYWRRRDIYRGFSVRGELFSVSDFIKGSGIVIDELRELAENNADVSVRASALAISWLYWADLLVLNIKEKSEIDLNFETKLFNLLLNQYNSNWLIGSAVELLASIAFDSPGAREFASELLRCAFSRKALRQLGPLMSPWREKSEAPITSSDKLGSWLGYETARPSYVRK